LATLAVVFSPTPLLAGTGEVGEAILKGGKVALMKKEEEKKEAEKVRAESTCGFKKGLLLCSHHLHIVALFLKE